MDDKRHGRDWNNNPLAGFGALINALGGGGDQGNMFPQSDADDLASGARFIPGEVTLARRRGEKVTFAQNCGNSCCWYWQMPGGICIYHWDRYQWLEIARANGKWNGEGDFSGDAGPCPQCGNKHTSGVTYKK
ncbi:MAG: hypothetical protein Q8O75_01690 [bacterium]|nr:hypothetical protein [bacterium]